jgi:ubiquinone/menaquinone biosynthesis C-methylase UbiE
VEADREQTKDTEKKHHENLYSGTEPLPLVDVAELRRRLLLPCYVGPGDHYSDNRWAFHQILADEGGWEGKHVLDYACGFGEMAIYYALTGARQVDGFDLAEEGVRRGQARVQAHGLADRIQLQPMDASNLTYPDEAFDLVIGHGVLHHVIKYPNIFEHLHRVMKPGTKAYFLEGLADFPLFKLWWKIKGEVPEGDVPIFSAEIRRMTHMFGEVRIIGDTFSHALKHFVWKRNPGLLRRAVLRSTHTVDRALFTAIPALRRWGSFSYIVLTK